MPHAYTEDQLVEQPNIGLFAKLLAAVKPALLAADREWQKVAANEAPTFRALSVLSPDENRLSDIIAELLSPRGSHGQGATFLTLFTSRCRSDRRGPLRHGGTYRKSFTFFFAY